MADWNGRMGYDRTLNRMHGNIFHPDPSGASNDELPRQ